MKIHLIEYNGRVYVWDSATPDSISMAIRLFTSPGQDITALAVSNDSNRGLFYYVATTSGDTQQTISVYNSTGVMVKQASMQGAPLIGITFWPSDSSILVAHSVSNIYLIDLSDGILVSTIETEYLFTGGAATVLGSSPESPEAVFSFVAGDEHPRRFKTVTINRDNLEVVISPSAIPQLSVSVPRGMKGIALANTYTIGVRNRDVTEIIKFESTTSTVLLTTYEKIMAASFEYSLPVGIVKADSIVITTSIHDPDTGEEIGFAGNVDLGPTPIASLSDSKIMRMKVSGVKSINNIKLALIDVAPSSIENESVLWVDPKVNFPYEDEDGTPLQPQASILLSDGTFSNTSNVPISNDGETESEYFALAMKPPEGYHGNIFARLVWMFDYEPKSVDNTQPEEETTGDIITHASKIRFYNFPLGTATMVAETQNSPPNSASDWYWVGESSGIKGLAKFTQQIIVTGFDYTNLQSYTEVTVNRLNSETGNSSLITYRNTRPGRLDGIYTMTSFSWDPSISEEELFLNYGVVTGHNPTITLINPLTWIYNSESGELQAYE